MNKRLIRVVCCLGMVLGLVLPMTSQAQTSTLTIYADGLAADWENWSWDTTVDFASTAEVYQGNRALAATFDAGWAGLYLHTEAALVAGYDTLRFQIRGNGSSLAVQAYDQHNNAVELVQITPPADIWTQLDVDLSTFGSSTNLRGLTWMNWSDTPQPTVYLDDIQLIASGESAAAAVAAVDGPVLRVDAAADHHPISPFIYGMAFADPALVAELGVSVNRWGGNATTRYNWQNDVANRAADWYFENLPEDNPDASRLPADSMADRFVATNVAAGAQTILTIPMIGWTPHDQRGTCGFSVAKYGAQQATDPWNADCGNGVLPDGSLITGNDPADTSLAIGPDFVQDWQHHLIEQFGSASAGGVRFYNLDNEPFLWHHTHRDVYPDPLSYDELRDRTYQYAAAIKAVDPDAQTLGPVVWGWVAYFYSGLDATGDAWWNNPVDRNAHGGEPLVAWYLDQMRLYEEQHGQRILDYLDLHYYPQAEGIALDSAGGAETQALRLRATRSLWDPGYRDESWIAEPVYLIPRMRAWVDEHYPGTKLAITEYNFGALDHINGALAQADVLGIFGREGLDLATLWTHPEPTDPVAFAFRMYRNYDGAGGAFGETGVQAVSADETQLAVYSALRADGALTVMVINKSMMQLNSPLTVQNFGGSAAEVYRYSAAHLDRIVREPDVDFSTGTVMLVFPPDSITLLVVQP